MVGYSGSHSDRGLFDSAMNQKRTEMSGYASLLHEIKGTDSETGLLTRTNLYDKLLREVARCDRYGNQLSIASMCITGQEAGQEDGPSADSFNDLANELGNQLGANVRNVDYAARWSENEFLVVLPETEIEGARQFMDKVESLVNKFKEEHSDARLKVVTEVTGWESGDDMSGLLSKVGL